MKILDAGHIYKLDSYDGDLYQELCFMKREGDIYPYNIGSHAGTNIQEVLRALIDRCKYLNNQIPCSQTELAQHALETALFLFEDRAAKRHDRIMNCSVSELMSNNPCNECGHIGCLCSHVDCDVTCEECFDNK